MCQQLEILEKIKKKGKVNGYDVELAEAQAKDFIMISKQVGLIKKDVVLIKKDNKRIFEMLARQGGQIDLLIKSVQSSQEDADRYRLLVDIWRALFGSVKKTVLTFVIFGIIIGIINIKDVVDLIRGLV